MLYDDYVRFQARARLSNNKARSWKWAEFENKARSDGLKLSHWSAGESQTSTPFADFNRNLPFPTYTDEDLNRHKSDDWTNEETDYMMDLCKTFDCRFIIGNLTFTDKQTGSIRDKPEFSG